MSFRELARELYRAKQKVSRLEKLIAASTAQGAAAIADELAAARAEERLLQRIIDGQKASPPGTGRL